MDWSAWKTYGPDFTPSGYVTAFAAFEAIAKKHVEGWVGNEFAFEQGSLAHAVPDPIHYFSPDGRAQLDHFAAQHHEAVIYWARVDGGYRAFGPPTLEEWKIALTRYAYALEQSVGIFERKALICLTLHKRLEEGAFRVHARDEASGEMVELPPHQWNCDHNTALARISRGRVNLAKLMSPIPSDSAQQVQYFDRMTSWLFVSKANQAKFLSDAGNEGDRRLDAEPVGASDLSAPKSSAKAVQPVRKGSTPGQKKRPAELRRIMLPIFQRWHDKLSDMSRSEKHRWVVSYWSDDSVTKPSERTVENHWTEYVLRRAAE
jgi:hypothetical protein